MYFDPSQMFRNGKPRDRPHCRWPHKNHTITCLSPANEQPDMATMVSKELAPIYLNIIIRGGGGEGSVLIL